MNLEKHEPKSKPYSWKCKNSKALNIGPKPIIPVLALKYPHRLNLGLLYALSTFLQLPPPCPAPVGEGRIPAGWGLSPGRTGALSPEGQGHRLTDSLATSDQAASE